MKLSFASVTPDNFDDLATLFEARDGPDFCWCVAWRDKDREVTHTKGAAGKALRKAALKRRVDRGEHVGLLAYDSDETVGWCSCGPLAGYRRLGGPGDVDPGRTWAISCFFVPRVRRGQGIMRALTSEAIATARREGAETFQVTGVAPDSPSYRFMGLVPVYANLGFHEVDMAGTRRHVMRLAL